MILTPCVRINGRGLPAGAVVHIDRDLMRNEMVLDIQMPAEPLPAGLVLHSLDEVMREWARRP